MSETGRDYSAIPRRIPPPPVARLNRRTVIVAALLLLALSGQLTLWVQYKTRARAVVEDIPPLPPAPSTDLLSALPRTYADIPTPDITPVPSQTRTFPPSLPPRTEQALLSLVSSAEAPTSPPAVTPPGAPVPVVHTPTPTPPAASGRTTPPPPKESVKLKRWLFVDLQNNGIAKPPFPKPEVPKQTEADAKTTTAGLLHPATWVRPADPLRTLFRSQVITGVLLDELNSDVPGQVRVKVTRPVLDKFQRGVVLIPQHSILLGTQDGQPVYGQSRLPVTLDQIEMPDGTLVRLTKAKLADQTGAQGVTGTVNHHLGRVILGAGLGALLSIGTRAPFGNTTNFQPTLPQEFAQDVGGSLNRSGQQIVQRELTVPPTIIVPAGTPVSLSLRENVSFSQPPTLAR